MKIITAESVLGDSADAVSEVLSGLRSKGCDAPELVICVGTASHDFDIVRRQLISSFPGAQIHGGSSCAAVMTERGHFTADGSALAVFAVMDPSGDYGVGVARLDNPRAAGAQAVTHAIDAAGRVGEPPEAVWLIGAPGGEEEVLAGVQSVVGPHVPLIGGSSADNAIEGAWKQMDSAGVYRDAVVIAALYPGAEVSARFHSGYDATPRRGVVTAAQGRRIVEIGGRPAADVYNEWTGGAIGDLLGRDAVVLERSNLHPLGRRIADVGGEPYFVLSHPETIGADGTMTVFTDINVGEELVCMTGDRANLVDRAGRVAAAARDAEEFAREDIIGSLVIFCAGCMMTVGDEMAEAQAKIRAELGPATPFIGAFTFGEQGFMADGENRHGNLMISVMHFAQSEAA